MKPKLIFVYIIALIVTLYTFISLITTENELYAAQQQNTTLQTELDSLHAKCWQYMKQVDELSAQLKEAQERLGQDKTSRGTERNRRIMECTAYWEGSCSKKPSDPTYGITASGKYVQNGYVAAWLKEYPIGTRLYIPYFDRVFTVMDCGKDITEGRLDLYMKSAKSCNEFGRVWLEVWEVE